MTKAVIFAAILMGAATAMAAHAAPDSLQEVGLPDGRLAATALEAGDFAKAQRRLIAVRPDAANDPARLINLGNAYAGMGQTTAARDIYTRALYAPDAMLVLANGTEESSRSIARRALNRLSPSYAMR